VLLQIAGLLHSLPFAGQDVFDQVFQHVDLRVGLVVVADEEICVALFDIGHLISCVNLFDEDVLGLAIELNLFAKVDELHLEFVIGVESQNARDFGD
jgi:hypothetical protein